MEYSIKLLVDERDRIKEELFNALDQEPRNWEVIVVNERLLADLEKAIELLDYADN